MSYNPIITTNEDDMTPKISTLAYECKFTVETSENLGGEVLTNIGGTGRDKRVTFEGYASPELYEAIIDAIGKVVE